MIRLEWSVERWRRRPRRPLRASRAAALLLSVGLATSLAWAPAMPAAGFAAAPAPPAPPPVTFGIGPQITANGQQRPYYNYGVTPGAGASDGVEITNLGVTPVAVQVYSVDVINNPDGTSALGLPIPKPSDVGSWITVKTPGPSVTVTVGARTSTAIPVVFAVPFNATPGDHVGGIVASLTSFARNAQGDVVKFDQRVGTRTYFRVSGKLVAQLTVDDLRSTYHQNYNPLGFGSVTVSFTIHNRGNVKLGVGSRVNFTGLFGTKRVAKALPDIPVLLPGGTARMRVTIADVPPEILGTAHVTLVPKAVLGDNDPPLSAVHASARTWTLPLVLIAIVIALGLSVWIGRRRRQRTRLRAEGLEPDVDELEAGLLPDAVSTTHVPAGQANAGKARK